MPLARAHMPHDLIIIGMGGTQVQLNRARYEEFRTVEGEPVISNRNPDYGAARREAFAALQVARKRAGDGAGQFVRMGEPAAAFLYEGRQRQQGEPDCDVIGRIRQGGRYGYWLGEGKGANIPDAVEQFEGARTRLATHRNQPGPVIGCTIVAPRLHQLEWNRQRNQWVAYMDLAEDANITTRLQPNIARARPTLQRHYVYLLGGPVDNLHQLPIWAVHDEAQPLTIWCHDRSLPGERGQFRPLLVGEGRVYLHYVC